ncbi:hypothetical protein [Campylobacter gracilis]|uniref:Uncharacterized protein n=1 Tax=Campylobacter gracilis RM3268 TaxID=553220 RepID=C8PL08_9BACT|nr:hypothetical protein [Campylobacter gracilis]AKT93089.1 hypothetical protein CGRAC_1668 [Campylobacter gracilis]EEV16423.1 hypothetical protein CAMGR0001_2798 [Campylobacter gracilis RM3268]UEB44739.1 hypothetical protein LK410_06875 [Campylobacter gracilis]SUW78580.1 Uncharacterised protein [Campylobacter gracilis]
MKVKNFGFAPLLALLFCFSTGAFADDDRSNVKIVPATQLGNEYRTDGGADWRQGWIFRKNMKDSKSAGCGDSDCFFGVYNFSNIKKFPEDMRDQKPAVRFGGAGSYVFGDYAVTSGSVITSSWPNSGTHYMFDSKGTYINDGGFTLNSSTSTLKLPKGVTADDIVYARLYWQGNVFNTEALDGFKATKDYHKVQFRMRSSKSSKATDIEEIERDRCDGYAAWNYNANTRDGGQYDAKEAGVYKECKSGSGPHGCATNAKGQVLATKRLAVNYPRNRGWYYRSETDRNIPDTFTYNYTDRNGVKHSDLYYRWKNRGPIPGTENHLFWRYEWTDVLNEMRLQYGCSKDITNIVRANFKDYSDSIDFTVGNIKTSAGWDAYGASFLNGGFETARVGAYGGWGVVIVYDKTLASRRKLMDDLQNSTEVTGAKASLAEAKKIRDTYFKPKNVTIYGDFITITPWSTPEPGYSPINVNLKLSGFYTPRQGKVNAKLGFLGFAGEREMREQEFFKVENKNKNTMDTLSGSVVNANLGNGFANIYDGSTSILELDSDGNYKLTYPKGTDYKWGMDLDEFDISSKMGNKQSSLDVQLGGASTQRPGGGESADQNFISMLAVSVDMYVPNMCYQYEVYNASNWVKFFDKDGNRRSEEDVKKLHEPPEQIKNGVVAGENIYYRIRFENRYNGGNSEDAVGSIVSVNFNRAGATYTPNSATINNRLDDSEYSGVTTKINAIPMKASQNLVYLRDGQLGAYQTMKDVITDGKAPNVTDAIYKNRQFTTLENGLLKVYIGEDAGRWVPPSKPDEQPTLIGGRMKPGKAAYAEFNATVNTGAKILQAPEMLLSYKISLDVGTGTPVEISLEGASELEICDDKLLSDSVNIQPLEGLQVVNKNFKNSDDDDRLYTQVSEMPFDGKLIFRPDYESHFCKKYNSTGECEQYTAEAASRTDLFVKDPATGELKYIGGKKQLEKFNLDGKLYLSVVRAKNAAMTAAKAVKDRNSTAYSCRAITDNLKIPFKLKQKGGGASSYALDHELDFKNKSILDLEDIEIGDAYQGVTFMLSYRPDGQANKTTKNDYAVDEDDPVKYYLALKKMELREKYGVCYTGDTYGWCKPLSDAEKAEKEELIKKELAKFANEISKASNTFGITMSSDGSFHVCGSDNFVIRPAYFNVDTAELTKYGKLVDTSADGDITNKGSSDASVVSHPKDLRVGGDYTENVDILAKVISARSYKGNGVPNYNAVIGGDLGNERYHIRDSYKYSDADSAQDISTKVRGIQTYLRPFISNQCAAELSTQSYYIKRAGGNATLQTGHKLDGCYGGTQTEYNGIEYDSKTGSYSVKKGISDADIKKNTFGKGNTQCKTTSGEINFDETYRRIWDKNAISLWADFNARNVSVTDAVATYKSKGNAEGSYLLTQSRMSPEQKDKVNGVLYTEMAYTTTEPKIAKHYFNYYNVGDVLVNVYDNSWTDAYADQTYSTKWKSAKCVINSSSNVPNNKGMVGCDVGMKNKSIVESSDPKISATNTNLVLRYRPDRIRVSLVSLDNGVTSGVGSIIGSRNVPVTDNNITGGISAYTYFNSPDIENNVVIYPGEDPRQNLAVTRQISQLAMLRVNAVAYLSDKVYKDVIATLYDGYKRDIGGNPQAVCGFSSDLDFALDFGFDCEHNNADGRCSKATNASKTSANINYAPYPDRSTVIYQIDKDTQFFAANSNECLGSTGYDSRCYKYNIRSQNNASTTDGIPDWEEAASGGGYGLPIPLRTALNYYSDANLVGGLINRPQGGTGINYDSKSSLFRILAQGFKEGQTPGSTVYFNFARMQKSPSTPVLIYASDFDIRDGVSTSENFWPSKFDKLYNAISDTTSEQYNKDGIKLSHESFDDFVTRKVEETTGVKKADMSVANKAAYINTANTNSKTYKTGTTITDFSDNIGTYALFVYGASYDKSLGSRVYNTTTRSSVTIPIYAQIYCGRTDGCSNMPAPNENLAYEVPGVVNASGNVIASNIFTVLAAQDHSLTDFTKFVVNTRATLNNIDAEFVSAYDSLTKVGEVGVNVTRGNVISAGKEDIIVSGSTAGQARVRIITSPWFIHTPAGNENTMFMVAGGGAYSRQYPGVRQYFNPLNVSIRAAQPTVWGGEGQVKSGIADDVGSFAGGSSSDNSTSDTSTRKLDTGDVRDIYNQKTDW